MLRRRLRDRPQLKIPKLCLGNAGARWCVSPERLCATSIVYSFGVGEDISFDLELIRRFGLTVHAFDPTPRSIQWISRQSVPEQFIFHNYGIAEFDGQAQFFPPDDPTHVSHSMVRRQNGVSLAVSVYRLTTIMQMLGHQSIDLLKMDVEGAEYAVLQTIVESQTRVQQLLVEFHHRWRGIGLNRTRELMGKLNAVGYRTFDISPTGEEYSFVLA